MRGRVVDAGAASGASSSRASHGHATGYDHGRYLLSSLRTTNTDTSANANANVATAIAIAPSPTNPNHNKAIFSSSTPPTGGESSKSISTRDPDLRRSSSGPPLVSVPSSPVSISTSASSVLFHEGLTRLDSFVDLTRLHHECSHVPVPLSYSPTSSTFESCDQYYDKDNPFFWGGWQTIQDDQEHDGEYLGYLLAGTDTGSTIPQSVTTANNHNSTFYSEPSPTIFDHPQEYESPLQTTCFFDPSSSSSAGASPRTPFDSCYRRQTFDPMAARRLVTPEPTEPTTSCTSAAGLQQQPYQQTMKNAQWRPQSAPKTTHSRSASPLAFWSRRGGASGGHQQLQDNRDESDDNWPRVGTSRGNEDRIRDDGDHMLVDTVSNHLGRLTPPSPSNSMGTSSSLNSRAKDRDLRISTKEVPKINCERNFSEGQPPMITKAEYEALPLAIQRKVCGSLFLGLFILSTIPSAQSPTAIFGRFFDTSN